MPCQDETRAPGAGLRAGRRRARSVRRPLPRRRRRVPPIATLHYNDGVPSESVQQISILKVRRGTTQQTLDWVVVEEPLEIRVGGEQLAVLMRTPGHDLELAAGFCLTEGVVARFADIGGIRHCQEDPARPSREGPNAVD